MATFKLVANDNPQEFEVKVELLQESSNLKNMVADIGNSDSDHPIPLSNISHETLTKVIEYLEHIVDHQDEKVDKSTLRDKDLNAWEKKFCSIEIPKMYQLILAANYLDIKHLLDIGCKHLADEMFGLSPEEIREKFGIENDWSNEELAQAKLDNAWLEEK